jgi:hypothetical protein
MSARARRATAKKVDYAKANEFSDDEIFEDSADDEPQPARRRARPRKSNASGVRTQASDPDNNEEYTSKPIYTEVGYDPSLPAIRERFNFLPEYEEDGSPKIESIVGRRPIDEKEEGGDKEGGEGGEGSQDKSGEVVETKTRPKRGATAKKTKGSPGVTNEAGERVEYEYLVKYKGRSYLHLEWKTGADLESMNKSAKGIYRRYLKKIAAGTEEDIENPEFDPSYAVPEKIVDEREQEITVELSDEELLLLEKQREMEMGEESESEEDMEDEAEDEKATDGQAANGSSDEEKKGEFVHDMM